VKYPLPTDCVYPFKTFTVLVDLASLPQGKPETCGALGRYLSHMELSSSSGISDYIG